MKTLFRILLIAILGLGLAACGGKSKKRERINNPRNTRTSHNGGTSVDRPIINDSSAGTIQASQQALDAFVSNMGEPEQVVGLINVAGAGIKFKTATGGRLQIEITDEYAVNNPGTAINLNAWLQVSSDIGAGQATMTYEDDYGQVEFRGSYTTNGNFTGTVYFQNFFYYDGEAPGASGILGTFSIPTCSFFNCN